MNVEARTKKYYDEAKERSYLHPVIRAFSEPKIEWIWKNIKSVNRPKILEVGAGNGYFSFQLMNKGQLTATDVSLHQLNFNPAKTKNACSVYELPFKNNSYDIVIESNLLHHLDDPEKAIAEMFRVSKKYIIFSEPNNLNPLTYFGSLIIPAERGANKFSKEYMVAILKKTGLRILKHTYIGGLVMPNGTPGWLLKFANPKSKSKFSFFQIFICAK